MDCFMKILDQNIQLSAQHYAATESKKQRVHETFIDGQLATRNSETLSIKSERFSSINQTQPKHLQFTDRLATANHQNLESESEVFTPSITNGLISGSVESASFEDKVNLPPKLIKMIEAIEALMERLTGKSYEMKIMGYESPNKPSSKDNNESSNDSNNQQNRFHSANMSLNMENGENLTPSTGERWSFSELYKEQELSSFRAQGHVTTENGQKIQFNLNAQMQRSFESHLHIERTEGVVFTDPLVVNFGGAPATLTVDKFQFDIDSDGLNEDISFVNQGSGFLALDSNQDGVINNGSELFGTQSGDGFADLRKFDHDQNGWIDENDAIFSQLQIWQKDANGFDQLQGLLELNIGAIALQNIATPFALKDPTNQQHGQAVSSGVFLHETGQAGSIQQIDLVI